jgi:hypothetical protein
MAAEDNGFWEKVGVGFLAGAGVALVAEGARALIQYATKPAPRERSENEKRRRRRSAAKA